MKSSMGVLAGCGRERAADNLPFAGLVRQTITDPRLPSSTPTPPAASPARASAPTQWFVLSGVSLLAPFEFGPAGVGAGRVQGGPIWSASRHHRKNGLALAFREARRARRARRSVSQLAVSKIEATLGQRAPRG